MARVTLNADRTPRRSASSSTTHGAELTFETLMAADANGAPMRLQPAEQTLLRVIDGILRLSIAGEDRLLGVGDEAIVPAAAPHTLSSACGRTRIVLGYRAA